MNAGFALRELRVTGPGVEDAVLSFADGMNVVAGPSDTGKTYVAQCLSFLLGSSKRPKDIPQAAAYDTARVVLVGRADGIEHVISRRLDGSGPVQYVTGDQPERRLRARHNPDRLDTLPAVLLAQSGLTGRIVRTHGYGKTRPLAFSDLLRLFAVDEETVISERSPIFSGQQPKRLAERRVFRLVLTGADDAAVVALDKPEIARSHRAGRAEVLQELLTTVRTDIARLRVDGSLEEAEQRVREWSTRVEAAAATLEEAQRAAAPVEERRRNAMDNLRRTRSLREHRRELQTRFELLRAQYDSDLERLAVVSEVGGRLEQLAEESCPVCGAAVEDQQNDHRHDHVSADEIADACRAEADKVRVLIRDLDATIASNGAELADLEGQESRDSDALSEVERELSSVLHPTVGRAARALRDSEAGRSRELRAVDLLRRSNDLDSQLVAARATVVPTRAEGSTDGANAGEAEAFTACVERLLKAWHFPGVDRVTWSETDQDIVVSGRSRASYGKGKRAIMRAAFNLGLLRVLLDEERPSPGLVLVDSPLVVYREPDVGEEAFPQAVKQHFYEAVARDFNDGQVVIFENDEPPSTLGEQATVTVFTGTSVGRTGFIPD